MSKTESRFKSKLESLKRFPHSASASGAVEKARAFFRSLELKHLGSSHEHSSSRRRIAAAPTTTTPTTINPSSLSSITVPSSSSCSKFPISSSISSSSSSSMIDESHHTSTTDSSSNPMALSNGIATARVIRVIPPTYSNPRDIIVHRVMDQEDELYDRSTSHYSVPPKRYGPIPMDNHPQRSLRYSNGIASPHERSHSYTVSIEKHRETSMKYDARRLSPLSTLSPSISYSSPIYEPSSPSSNRSSCPNSDCSDQHLSTSIYNYRPLVCRQIGSPSLMSSSFHEETHRSEPIIRPLSSSVSSSSVSSWNQSVRRLNSEYASTINALQRARQSLEQIYPHPTDTISKYANMVARGIENLSKNADEEAKKLTGVTFCLTTPMINPSTSTPPVQTSKIPIQQSKQFSTTAVFSKPKVIRPMELDTFAPVVPRTLPKLEPMPINKEKNETIANIIHKFNNLNGSIPSPTSTRKSINIIEHTESKENPRESLSQTIICDAVNNGKEYSKVPSPSPPMKSFQLKEIPYESPPPPRSSSSSSSSISEDSTSSTSSMSETNPIYAPDHDENNVQEETTYTVETFYKTPTNGLSTPSFSSSTSLSQQLVIIRENTTEEQFNLAREKPTDEVTPHRFTVNQTQVPPLTTPLLTYLNLTTKPMKPTPSNCEEIKDEKINNNNYQSLSSSSLVEVIEDDENLHDIVTINPHPYSPPLSSSSHHLISSSSSTSSHSSTSTVLLSGKVPDTQPSSNNISPAPTNVSHSKTSAPAVSQLPKRISSTTNPPNKTPTRLKTPTKTVSSTSKIKAPSTLISTVSSTSSLSNAKSTKSMNHPNSTTALRKPTGIGNNQSSTMNKTIQAQSSTSTLTIGKKSQLANGGSNMTESASSTIESSMNPLGKNRVRSMVNQFNAAARPTNPEKARIPTLIGTRRTMTIDSPTMTKSNIVSPPRPSLQRAMTINHNSPTPPSPPVTPSMINPNPLSNSKRKTPLIRSTSNVKEGLLRWCQAQVAGYPNVSVTNLSSSWADGMAFCALTHRFFPDAFDFHSLSPQNRKENLELAFRVAEERGGVPRLLDVSDMLIMGNTPDYKCIFTYLNSFLAKVKDLHPH